LNTTLAALLIGEVPLGWRSSSNEKLPPLPLLRFPPSSPLLIGRVMLSWRPLSYEELPPPQYQMMIGRVTISWHPLCGEGSR
jgi:hypothetical protein